ncbi:tetratricopeptide repeat protein [Candidatus Uabimicrobium sp. HlEnr_7]|uniref:protein kinase domain-containing protein n=1 Tax=Candidatus Uabimicrobium helgolandensis TaxID=3095367 RepID=UPI0035565CC1
MDKDEIKHLWEKIITKDHIEDSDGGETYRSKDWPPQPTAPTLPMISFSKQSTFDMTPAPPTAANEFTIGGAPQQELAETAPTEDFQYDTSAEVKHPNNHYELLNEIARGGMGVVYKGCQNSLRREIAIKKIINDNQNNRNKFLCESIVTAHLDHPNIVPVHELAQNENGETFLAMKLVGGREWKQILYPKNDNSQAKKYDTLAHLNVLLNVCNAIAYAHSKEIVHCDLKPSNVMVGEFGEVLVMDWGIAVEIGEKHRGLTVHKTMIDGPMGTPYYMPSELASGHGMEIGPWTDIYLLGGILYEILMRTPPHKGHTMTAIFAAIMGQQPKFSDDIPQELQQICLKALSKNIKDRYQSVDEFSKAIQKYLQHRESLIISQKAKNTLQKCLTSNKQNSDLLYSDFAQSVAGFEQALQLWSGNENAQLGKEQARIEYAKVALKQQDFGLAQAQLSSLQSTSEITQLQNKIDAQRNKKLRIEKTTVKLRRTLYAAAIIIIVGLATGFLMVGKAYREAVTQRKLADKQKELAKKNEQIAQQARQDVEKKSEQLSAEKNTVQSQRDDIVQQIAQLKKQKQEIGIQNKRLLKQKSQITQQKRVVEEQNQFLTLQKNRIEKQSKTIEEEKSSAIEASRIALRTIHKIFFEIDGAQRDPGVIQSLKNIFKEMKRLNMLETILANEEDAWWLYGIIHGEIKTYSDLIRQDPNNYSAYYNRGNLYIDHGILDKAINDFSKAIELNPQLTEAYFNRGLIFFKKESYTYAEKDFSKSIELDPNNSQFLYYRAYLLLRLEKYSKAEKDLLAAIRLNPSFAAAHEKLGILYFDKAQYKKSVSHFKNTLKGKPNSRKAYYYLARIYSLKGNKSQAINYLKLAIENKFTDWQDLKTNPDFAKIRNEKQFKQWIK